jgi:hypothetical protein
MAILQSQPVRHRIDRTVTSIAHGAQWHVVLIESTGHEAAAVEKHPSWKSRPRFGRIQLDRNAPARTWNFAILHTKHRVRSPGKFRARGSRLDEAPEY